MGVGVTPAPNPVRRFLPARSRRARPTHSLARHTDQTSWRISVRFEEMIAMIAVTAILSISVVKIVTAIVSRNRQPALPPSHDRTEERLARIEQAVDAIAVEVERISEGQRFTTKLLAEKSRESV